MQNKIVLAIIIVIIAVIIGLVSYLQSQSAQKAAPKSPSIVQIDANPSNYYEQQVTLVGQLSLYNDTRGSITDFQGYSVNVSLPAGRTYYDGINYSIVGWIYPNTEFICPTDYKHFEIGDKYGGSQGCVKSYVNITVNTNNITITAGPYVYIENTSQGIPSIPSQYTSMNLTVKNYGYYIDAINVTRLS